MKKIKKSLNLFFILPLIAVLLAIPELKVCGQERDVISVTGHASLKVKPDIVAFTIEISARDSSMEKAKAEHDRRARSVLQLLEDLGVPDENLRTDHMHIREDWMFRTNQQLFNSEQTLGILLTDVDGWEVLLQSVLDAGATGLRDVQFWTSKADSLRTVLQTIALRDAIQKATSLAAVLGKQLGRVIQVTDNENIGGRSFFREEVISVTASAYSVQVDIEGMAPISKPGFIEMKGRVWVVFEFVDPDS
jgi:uncharacterized protein YggE